MPEPHPFRLPRIRFQPFSVMRYEREPLAAVAKAGGQTIRLQRFDGVWVVTHYSRGRKHVPAHVDWTVPIGDVPREIAIAAFVAMVVQHDCLHATLVIATVPAVRP